MPRKNSSSASVAANTPVVTPIDDHNDQKDDIKDILKNHLEKIEKSISESEASVKLDFDSKFNLLDAKLKELESISLSASATANDAFKKATDVETSVAFINENLESLQEASSSATQINSLIKKGELLSNRLEDQTNRTCRKTLIIRGVKENPLTEKSWDDTKKVVAEIIQHKCRVEIDPDEHIERAHRGKKISVSAQNKFHRDIHVCFYDWNDTRRILDGFKQHGFVTKDNIFIEQRYGPDTTWRRNEAKLLRKNLKLKKEIISGYIAFPARLMVKTSPTGKYHLHSDFSNKPVAESV